MNLYLEYAGGLGDVLHYLYTNNSYNLLLDLKADEKATVALMCHNPHASELFTGHPKVDQIEIMEIGFHNPGAAEDRIRLEKNLPPRGAINRLPFVDSNLVNVQFFPLAADHPFLSFIRGSDAPYVVIAASASTPERDLPEAVLVQIVADLTKIGITPVFVGRNYQRSLDGQSSSHQEPKWVNKLKGINLVDQLSVPGTCELIRGSRGLVTCHSAFSMLAWRMKKPTLVLYPKALQKHFILQDGYSCGVEHGRTVHGLFEEYSIEMQDRFDKLISP